MRWVIQCRKSSRLVILRDALWNECKVKTGTGKRCSGVVNLIRTSA